MPARNDPQVFARRLRAVLISSIPVLEARGIVIVLMAGMVGAIAGALVTGMSALVQGMHYLLFDVQPGGRLSAMFSLAD
ncbi:MAG: chloride channel protein, partial [Mesorhizobium sp.]